MMVVKIPWAVEGESTSHTVALDKLDGKFLCDIHRILSPVGSVDLALRRKVGSRARSPELGASASGMVVQADVSAILSWVL